MTSRVFLVGSALMLAIALAGGSAPDVSAQSMDRRAATLTSTQLRSVARVAALRAARGETRPAPRVAWRDTVAMYTADQLTAGTETYNKVCKGCHEDTDYTNDKFKASWNGKTLFDLYGYVHDKMPDDNPGSLTPDEYAGSISYILKLNGVPAGPNKVMPDSAAMRAVTLNFAAPAK